ncbi:class I SAM-dependent methyltransferase [Microbacterium deminutum]|uniref:Class I SAM-dependent methyltransferase n=2 Tax=Microbacterium deminutum TaxID=344164 RepID=A0ABN2Q2X5_9MICO
MHFDADAAGYESARPPYPDALWACLHELGALRPGLRALDLGAGSGQATGPLLEAGLTVTAVEPGVHLAARLSERFPEAVVLVSRAEDAVLPTGSFDVVVAATSIHWMDLAVVLPKVRAALVDRGLLLVWANEYGDPSVPRTPFRERVETIVRARAPLPPDDRQALDPPRWAETFTRGGHFRVVRQELFRWAIDLDAAQVRALFATFSNWTADEANEAADAVCSLGGTVHEHYTTPLIALEAV